MSRIRIPAALGALAATSALALAPALSSADEPGTPAGAGTVGGPVPADVSKPAPVTIDFKIIDAQDRTVDSGSCAWTYAPGDDDRECLAFQGDPQTAVAKIEAAGGVRVVKHQTAPAHGIDTTTRISRRADGDWVFRTTGKVDGKPWKYVRTYDPDAKAKKSSKKKSARR